MCKECKYYNVCGDDNRTELCKGRDTSYKERCSDCICLAEKDGKWFCDEAQDYCRDIKCPEGI